MALYLTGNRYGSTWTQAEAKSDFFFLKGIVEAILERLGFQQLQAVPPTTENLSEGLTFKADNVELVTFGTLKDAILEHFDLKQEVLFADFDWDTILQKLPKKQITFKGIPKFPAVKRDLALLLDEGIAFDKIYQLALNTEKKLLKEVALFDVYKGKNIPAGKKSYAVSFTLLDEKKTLTDKHIDKIMGNLQEVFKKELGAEIR